MFLNFQNGKKSELRLIQAILGAISQYDQILFTSPESVTDFFTILVEQEIDIRQIKAQFYGASTKSVKLLKEKGFLAQLEM